MGLVCDFCSQKTGELPDIKTALIKYLPTTIHCSVYMKFEQLPY
jgi:hypothetical protein